MGLDLEEWGGKIRARLCDWRRRMQGAGIDSTYAFLSAAALWPVVEAFRGGDVATVMALGQVVAGVGTNLLANCIQGWKDEADGARQITKELAERPEIRQELDAVLEKLNAITEAGKALPEAEHDWFVSTLRKELAGLQSLERFSAQLTGIGVIVQGHMYGDVNYNIQQGRPGQDSDVALARYRKAMFDQCRPLPLRGFDRRASDPASDRKHISLEQVYVVLDTMTPRRLERPTDEAKGRMPENIRNLRLLEAAAGNQRLVILGDPGSGKSTFLKHLTLCLLGHGLEPDKGWLSRIPDWPAAAADLIPVPVVLRDFARTAKKAGGKATPRHLWDFIHHRLRDQNLDFAAEPLKEALAEGRALVLLDGLDEIPAASAQSFVREAVLAFANCYQKSRMLVTCRTLSYERPEWRLPSFPDCRIAPFDAAKIDLFIKAWYAELEQVGELTPALAANLTRQLLAAVQRPDLRRLSPNPLLLTVMALVNTHKSGLPDARALLYEDAVDYLLWLWDQIKTDGEQEVPVVRRMLTEVGRAETDLKRVLAALAFESHRQGGTSGNDDQDRLADISESSLLKAFARLHPNQSLDWAKQLIESIKLRAGLLSERETEVYTFPHRTFEEYLAGTHLAATADFVREAAGLAGQGALWREVILLAVGRMVYVSTETARPLALVAELCPEKTETLETTGSSIRLAGEVLLEMGVNRAQECNLGKELFRRVQQRLVNTLTEDNLDPGQRAEAGRILARMGDPRPGVGLREDGLPDIDWLDIPKGPFIMGCGPEEKKWDDEQPRFTCNLIRDSYRISRYPVTVAQYRAFVEARGYERECYWTKAGWGWRKANKVTGPDDYEEVFQTANHPQTGVSWYEAMAFCAWLSEVFKFIVTLPQEAQWERAARHTDGRTFPWGEDGLMAKRCNMIESGIGATTSVGIFRTGIARCGAADMAGNVWEWCVTKWLNDYEEYEKKVDDDPEGEEGRVLRGGSFVFSADNVRCAARFRSDPVDRDGGVGFRVVSSPITSEF